jgi:hypothetical protein
MFEPYERTPSLRESGGPAKRPTIAFSPARMAVARLSKAAVTEVQTWDGEWARLLLDLENNRAAIVPCAPGPQAIRMTPGRSRSSAQIIMSIGVQFARRTRIAPGSYELTFAELDGGPAAIFTYDTTTDET